ncbi:hypothetical protein G9F73_016300 [Clostridium estertheticum]|uniref:hypothetical protein n=1 Tax=Clostridium estertheticum TaxID=238834 RepID=UPI0013EE6DCC|nr:hypothetical protein [Clostridium estertheticum]MBZ9609351.1 hypothetical protein [Clostridium estertheticum]
MKSKISNNLYYTCSLIEFIGRETKNKRYDIVNLLGEEAIRHILEYADVFHSEQIAAVADRFIEEYKIEKGHFDNVNDCKYNIPDYWSIGAVYQRLIENVYSTDLVITLIEVYNSWINSYIDDYNMAIYYMTPQYLKVCYEQGEILE